MKMSEGFIKLYREGLDLLKDSSPAFLLFVLIALRAKRADPTYSIYKLKANEAFIGDYGTIGLTRSQYRTAIEKLEKQGLVKFQTNTKGTIFPKVPQIICMGTTYCRIDRFSKTPSFYFHR